MELSGLSLVTSTGKMTIHMETDVNKTTDSLANSAPIKDRGLNIMTFYISLRDSKFPY